VPIFDSNQDAALALCLIGARMAVAESLFVGWFGPRGLASIVFVVMVIDVKLPGNTTLVPTVLWTVVMSVICHGLTANSFALLLARQLLLRHRAEGIDRTRAECSIRLPLPPPLNACLFVAREVGLDLLA
jgi:NhaP-type Na+/H+ or K+/H+ antiporter